MARHGSRDDQAPRGIAARVLFTVLVFIVGVLVGRASVAANAPDAAGSQGGKSPTRTVDGVRIGFPRTRSGAAAAVASYQRAFADAAILRASVLRRRIEVVASPDYAQAMLFANSPGRERLAQGAIGLGVEHGIQTLYVGVPIGYRVESFSPRRARILTWGFTLLGNASAVPARAYFGLTHTDLVWLGGEWRIARTEASFGPTPRLQTPPGPVDGYNVVRLAKELRSYELAP
jgi:hypothetical protein